MIMRTAPNTDLWRLVYWSRNMISGVQDSDTGETEIRRILETARRNNPKHDVTGALMFNRGTFAQVLEGPRDGLIDVFERIQCDLRHADVVVLEYAAVSERRFPQWSMAFVGPETSGEFGDIADESGFVPERMTSEAILAAIRRKMTDTSED